MTYGCGCDVPFLVKPLGFKSWTHYPNDLFLFLHFKNLLVYVRVYVRVCARVCECPQNRKVSDPLEL